MADDDSSWPGPGLGPEAAGRFVRLALRNVRREYPNHTGHLVAGPTEDVRPRALHPAFYGSYDWHSCVHQHWLLVRLLQRFPGLPEEAEVRRVLGEHLTPEALEREADYLRRPAASTWERPYGWAWALSLAAACRDGGRTGDSADPDLPACAAALEPLTAAVTDRFLNWLPRATYPVRHGVHSNSAFGVLLALTSSRRPDDELARACADAALRWFGDDRDYPAGWEPSGEDFLSPALTEAALMLRVLGAGDFGGWLDRFLPGLPAGEPVALLTPARVSDRSDPRIVHLDGLNLSRAWCWSLVAGGLPPDDPRAAVAATAWERHLAASLAHVESGDYGGEHWLATFAVLATLG